MTSASDKTRISRRHFIKSTAMTSGALAAGPALAAANKGDDPAITRVQDWSRYLGDGTDARPYGMPAPFEKDVKRRNVRWLTASTESSVGPPPCATRGPSAPTQKPAKPLLAGISWEGSRSANGRAGPTDENEWGSGKIRSTSDAQLFG